jgi:hypothetical protein
LQLGFSNAAAAAPDPTVNFHELRDSLHVARYAAALARQMLEVGRAHRHSNIAVLAPNNCNDPVKICSCYREKNSDEYDDGR